MLLKIPALPETTDPATTHPAHLSPPHPSSICATEPQPAPTREGEKQRRGRGKAHHCSQAEHSTWQAPWPAYNPGRLSGKPKRPDPLPSPGLGDCPLSTTIPCPAPARSPPIQPEEEKKVPFTDASLAGVQTERDGGGSATPGGLARRRASRGGGDTGRLPGAPKLT